jgi:hypothetical protein
MTEYPNPLMVQVDPGAQQVAPAGQVIPPELGVEGVIVHRPANGQDTR